MALLASPSIGRAIHLSSGPARGSSSFSHLALGHQLGGGRCPHPCRLRVLGTSATCWRSRDKTSIWTSTGNSHSCHCGVRKSWVKLKEKA